MAVRTRKRGKTWSYSFDITPAPDGKRRMREKGGFATKEEAYTAGAAAYTDWKNGDIGITSEKVTVKEYLNKFQEVHQAEVKVTTRCTQSQYLKNITAYLGGYILQELRPRDIDAMYQKLAKDGYSYSTISNIHGYLHMAMNYAVYPLELLAHNPVEALKVPKSAIKKVVERKVISTDKLQELLEKYPFGTPTHIPLQLAYFTGLRIGELIGLTWDCIDLQNKTLTVKQQLQRVPHYGVFLTSPKTTSSIRTIVLDQCTAELLQRWKVYQKKLELSTGNSYIFAYLDEDNRILEQSKGLPPPENAKRICFVCTCPNGAYFKRETFSLHLKKEGLNSHSFRHTMATLLIEEQATPKSVAARLGHKNTTITQDLYTHVTKEMQNQTAAIIDNFREKYVDKSEM